ncbi:bacterial group 3 Ig-like protein [Lawsonibacter asaccharolyticus]|nr:bacterial group 3 Ig-like protein [Lawsonibacter asaccharolyticus]
MPDKTQYKERLETLDVTGAELELNFDYGDPEIIQVHSDMVKGFDNRRAGGVQG